MPSNMDYAHQARGAVGVDPNHPAGCGYRLDIIDAEQGVVKAYPAPRRKFAICGFAASSRMAAPFDDPEWEIWTLNQLYRHVPRATRQFDIHANWAEDNVEGTDHPGWLAQCGIPVYMTRLESTIPTSVRYPLERVIARVTSADYFTSTVAFMIALAVAEIDEQVEAEIEELSRRIAGEDVAPGMLVGITLDTARGLVADPRKFLAWRSDRYSVREIGIFGIDLIVGGEYDGQKACVEFMLGLAQARNITIRIPQKSALLKQLWRYGYEAEPASGLIKLSEMRKRAEALTNERNAMIARLQALDGALQENGYWGQVMDLRSKGGSVKLNESTE